MKKRILAIMLSLSACVLVLFGCEQGTTENSENNITDYSKNDISTTENSIPESESSDTVVSTEQPENESSSDFELKPQYFNDVQRTVYTFFKAYVLGDIDTAKSVMDSPENPCLEEFPTKNDSWCIGSMDKVESYYVELIRCDYNEKSETTEVTVDVAYSDITDESIFYISIDLSTDDINGGIWKINQFFEEA